MADPISDNTEQFRAEYERLKAQLGGGRSPAELAEQKVLEELKAKHGEIWVFRPEVRGEKRLIVTVMPSEPVFDRYAAAQFDDGKKHVAPRSLLKDVTVFPGAQELDELLEQRPGLGLALGAKVAKYAGAAEEIEAGKF